MPPRQQKFKGVYVTGCVAKDKLQNVYLTLADRGKNIHIRELPIYFTYQQTLLLEIMLRKLRTYLLFDKNTMIVNFSDIVDTFGSKRIKLKCIRQAHGKLVVTIQQDCWDTNAQKWLNGKQRKEDTKL